MANDKVGSKDTCNSQIGKPVSDEAHLYGHFSIDHVNKDGELISHEEFDNVIVDAGKAQLAGLLLADIGGTAFDYIALGIGTTTATATQTALVSEIVTGGGERTAGTGTRVTTAVTNDTAQLVATFNFTDTFAVTESGIFNDPSAGTMLARRAFAAKNVESGDSITVTWKVQVT